MNNLPVGVWITLATVALLFLLALVSGTGRRLKLIVQLLASLIIVFMMVIGLIGAGIDRNAAQIETKRSSDERVSLMVAASTQAEKALGLEGQVKQLEFELAQSKQSASEREKDLQSKLDDLQKNAEQLAKQVAEISHVRDGLLVTLNSDVLFEVGQSELKCDEKVKLSKVVAWLQFQRLANLPSFRLRLTGHTDNFGPDSVNEPLSFSRAKAVADYLIASGMPTEVIDAPIGKGRSQPKGFSDAQATNVIGEQNKTADLRAKNRRVEILIVEASPPR